MSSETTYEELIVKLLDHSIRPDELDKLDIWLQLSQVNQDLFDDYVQLWYRSKGSVLIPESQIEEDLNRVHKSLSNKDSSLPRTSSLRRVIWWTMSAAAIFLLVIFGLHLFDNGSNLIQEMELADGSQIWLDSGSSLEIDENFNMDGRAVFLAGRAFFDVAHDPSKPFKISTDNIAVEVLGTSFSVEDIESKIEVNVTSGRVAVKMHEWGDSSLILLAGDQLKLENGSLAKGRTNKNTFAWKTKEIQFQENTLRQVADILTDVYGINISLSDGISNNCAFTANFKNTQLEEVLEVLSRSCGIKIQQIKGNYLFVE